MGKMTAKMVKMKQTVNAVKANILVKRRQASPVRQGPLCALRHRKSATEFMIVPKETTNLR